MQTIDLELALMNHFNYTQNICVPNVTTISGLVGFEVDMLVLTQANFAYAVEIKVSKSDLKADLSKKHIRSIDNQWSNMAFEKCFQGIKHFYYCVPQELQGCAQDQIPGFCGLLVASKQYEDLLPEIELVRKPKQIFGEKWSESAKQDLMRLGCLRTYSLKNRLRKKN